MAATDRAERRLAAILAADIVGYSRLIERDEAGTLAAIKVLRREVIDPLIAEHRGRVVKFTGDGAIVEFTSVVDAAACAAAVQKTVAEWQAGVPPERLIVFRIGVNLGDVVVEGDGDLLGDGVNVAARLERLCEPGGVLVSGTIYDHLQGKLAGVPLEFAGERQVKNIERPVRTYRMVLGGARPPERPALPLPDKPSLAVLPFDNLSGEAEQGYFADGIVEDIITALSRTKWLFVIARNSSFTYRGRAVDVRQVGRELGVRYVLEGSVRKAGERVRITGQLIDALSGAHLWAEHFEGILADVFELQDRVAEGVAGAIEPTLRGAEIERARRKPTESLGAYDLYLRALPHLVTPTAESNREARRLLDQALALDPDYAVALGFKAWSHLHAYLHSWAGEGEAERIAGEQAARRVLTLGQDDPTALAMGGFVLSLLAHDHEAGLAALSRAVTLNPNSALAFGASALVHCFAGDYDTAIEHAKRSLRLSPFDPLSFRPLIALANAYLFTKRYEATARSRGHRGHACVSQGAGTNCPRRTTTPCRSPGALSRNCRPRDEILGKARFGKRLLDLSVIENKLAIRLGHSLLKPARYHGFVRDPEEMEDPTTFGDRIDAQALILDLHRRRGQHGQPLVQAFEVALPSPHIRNQSMWINLQGIKDRRKPAMAGAGRCAQIGRHTAFEHVGSHQQDDPIALYTQERQDFRKELGLCHHELEADCLALCIEGMNHRKIAEHRERPGPACQLPVFEEPLGAALRHPAHILSDAPHEEQFFESPDHGVRIKQRQKVGGTAAWHGEDAKTNRHLVTPLGVV
jgi:adenylate cyclase